MAETKHIKGKVKFYNQNRGYGFIDGEDGEQYYIGFRGISKGHKRTVILENEEVEFDVTDGKKGVEATNCCIIPLADDKKDGE